MFVWRPLVAETPAGVADESEDCLYLNVYAPANSTGAGLPVLVWIYGGDLQKGSAGRPAWDGSSFVANQDIVVVTFNYRLNGSLPHS